MQTGRERRPRAGTLALSTLATPGHAAILQALANGRRSFSDLRHAAGSPSESTLRGRLRRMSKLGTLSKDRGRGARGVAHYELGPPGRELLAVMSVLGAWLAQTPTGPLALGSQPAKRAVEALIEGWSSNVVRALAAKPLTLTELDRLIASLNYPSVERHVARLRRAGQIEQLPSRESGKPYAVTGALRRGVGPLTAAARWERQHAADSAAPLGRLDIEASFLLAVPLVDLPRDLTGICRLTVEIATGEARQLAGVRVKVDKGRIASHVTRLKGEANAWASGSSAAWLGAVVDQDQAGLEVGGDCDLVCNLVDAVHGALFRAAANHRPRIAVSG